jgi:hypothetical protein
LKARLSFGFVVVLWEFQLFFARDMGNLVGQCLCFEKSKHTKAHLVEGETIFEKTQHKILLEVLKFYFKET